MNKIKLFVVLILMLSVSPLFGQDNFGSWEIESSEYNGYKRYKAFTKAQDHDIYFIILCVPNVDPRDSFLIVLEQQTPFEPIEKTSISMKAVFDDNDPINLNWLFNKKVLMMYESANNDSQWFAEKMRLSNSLTLHFRDLYGKKVLNLSLIHI